MIIILLIPISTSIYALKSISQESEFNEFSIKKIEIFREIDETRDKILVFNEFYMSFFMLMP